MKTEKITVGETSYEVYVTHENRKGSRVSIGKRSVKIRLPLSLSREEAFRQLLKMKNWARDKLEKQPERFKKEAAKEYKDGDTLKIGDDNYILKIDYKNKQSSSAIITGNAIHLVISSALPKEKQNKHASSLISRCIARKRLPALAAKINELNKKHFNKQVNKIFFKNISSRWGSCSANGNINISTRLLFAPDGVLECVCIHELAHLIEKNHSSAFWALVENAMPDYKEKKEWLNNEGHKCVF